MSVADRLRYSWGSALHHARDAIIEMHLATVRTMRGPIPLPLAFWRQAARRLSAITGREESLALQRAIDGPDVRIGRLAAQAARALEGSTLGHWAIDAETADWLWQQALHDKPRFIVECGAGISTLLLSAALREVSAGQPTRLVTLEENGDEAARVRARLGARGLADAGEIIIAPMSSDGRYQFEKEELTRALGQQTADWIFIDGPAAADRTKTLPALAVVARAGTRWMLDDAFTPEYFAVADAWSSWPGLTVEGVVPIGKGVATGRVTDPAAAVAEFVRRFGA